LIQAPDDLAWARDAFDGKLRGPVRDSALANPFLIENFYTEADTFITDVDFIVTSDQALGFRFLFAAKGACIHRATGYFLVVCQGTVGFASCESCGQRLPG